MSDYTFFHQTNIIIHVGSGVLALLLGLVALSTKKGGRAHRKSGLLFLLFLAIVVTTGLLGVLVFNVNQFLLVLTVLSGYNGYSGYRAIKNKSNIPKTQDILVAFLSLGSGIYFLHYMESIGMIWSPVIIYATLGFLFFIISYDLLRYLIPPKKYGKLWLYEHIYKMIAAFTALAAAASGTLLPNYKPYSQFLPSLLGTLLTVVFIVYFYRKSRVGQNEITKRQS